MNFSLRRLFIPSLLILLGLIIGGCAPVPEAPPQASDADTIVLPPPPAEIDGLPVILREELPPEAHDTIELIKQDGPYPYDKDGTTFQNREGLLPDHPRGYYREFTVDTPGLSHRGARRIVTGSEDEYYYTDDHYESFSRVWNP